MGPLWKLLTSIIKGMIDDFISQDLKNKTESRSVVLGLGQVLIKSKMKLGCLIRVIVNSKGQSIYS